LCDATALVRAFANARRGVAWRLCAGVPAPRATAIVVAEGVAAGIQLGVRPSTSAGERGQYATADSRAQVAVHHAINAQRLGHQALSENPLTMLVYFFLPENDDVYFDAPLVLAEGLRDLGVPFFCNRNYWRTSPESGETLFRHDPHVTHDEADVVVIHDDWFYHLPQSTFKITERPAPSGLFKSKRNYRLVYLDTWIGARGKTWDADFRECELILKAQYNRRCAYPSNVKPWALGFTSRVLRATESHLPFAQRKRVILDNFSYTHPYAHGSREIFREEIAPLLRDFLPVDTTMSQADTSRMSVYEYLMWEQSVDKHNPDYFDRLKHSMMVATFCGPICPGLPADAFAHYRGGRRYRAIAEFYRVLSGVLGVEQRAMQWDSWRFWETLCAGAAAMHVDLEKYGVALPVMPENWKHYIGVDFRRPLDAVDRIEGDPGLLERVARDGRVWALENYSPRAMAERMLDSVGSSPMQPKPHASGTDSDRAAR
jgi:hypothetical protein